MVVKAFGVLDNDDGSSQLTVSEHIQFYTTMISIDHEVGYWKFVVLLSVNGKMITIDMVITIADFWMF